MKTVAVRWEEGLREGEAEGEGEGTPLGQLAAPGRMIEVSGVGAAARHTTAAALVRQAQLEGETTVWIQPEGGSLFPPDLADAGVDLQALIVVHVPRDRGEVGLARAAELMLRSGAVGLCVLDLSEPPCPEEQVAKARVRSPAEVVAGASGAWRGPRARAARLRGAAWQARLAGLARLHHCRVVVLTRSSGDQGELGALCGLRVEPRRERHAPGVFVVRPQVVKHKGAPLRAARALRRGPWGLV
jgi:recombination protein RecA